MLIGNLIIVSVFYIFKCSLLNCLFKLSILQYFTSGDQGNWYQNSDCEKPTLSATYFWGVCQREHAYPIVHSSPGYFVICVLFKQGVGLLPGSNIDY